MKVSRFEMRSILLGVTLIWVTVFLVNTTDGACSTIDNCDVCYNSTSCSQCSLHYGLTADNKACQRCDTNAGCSYCTNLTMCDICRSLSIGPDRNGTATWNGTGTCSPCAANCEQCTQAGSGLCDSCNLNYTLAMNKTCVACPISCPYCIFYSNPASYYCFSCYSGYYINRTNNNNCQPCPPGCSDCQLLTSGQVSCSSCTDPTYFLNQISQLCQKCTRSNCSQCVVDKYGGVTDSCAICNSGYYLVNSSRQVYSCAACPPGCATCQVLGPGNITCSSCSDFSYYFNLTSQICQKCTMSNCTQCDDIGGLTDSCSYCNEGYYRTIFRGIGLYIIFNCEACSSNCRTCYSGLPTNCYSCYSGYSLSTAALFCAECDVPFCDACVISGTKVCDRCLSGYYLSPSGLSCTLPFTVNVTTYNSSQTSQQSSTKDGSSIIGVIVLAILLGLTIISFVIFFVICRKRLTTPIKEQQPQQQETNVYEHVEVSAISPPADHLYQHIYRNNAAVQSENVSIQRIPGQRQTLDFDRCVTSNSH